MTECIHEMEMAWCAICTRRTSIEEEAEAESNATPRLVFPAKWPGQCSECGSRWSSGSTISAKVPGTTSSKMSDYLCGPCTRGT